MTRFVLLATLLVSVLTSTAQQTSLPKPGPVTIDASAAIAAPETGFLHLGGTSSDGHSLEVNSRYLVLDGKPWLPVMGEFHFSRYPPSEWEDEILKMQAAGINIVSTYIFWIHHEEVEGSFDWAGQRDLRRFVQLCGKHGMYVWLRVGPWAHGEARNGGFPDWVAKLPNTRTNDPVYLRFVDRFFHQIGAQVQGLMFKDGGPVIGTQLENEYGLHGAGRGAEHILKLKQIAIASGIETPLYSVTGWPSLDFPPREVIPVSGGYPDGFWYASQRELPPSMTYLFNFNRELGDMGATVASEDPTGKVDLKHDPYFAAEEAGGMASAYHRRPVLSADDIAALTLTNLGSGINLYGYYMFHGGANPKGRLTTLQESSATGYPNDLPEVTYDFEAPLGEFGQERESYRKTRLLHLFLNAYGAQLASMPALPPAERTRDAGNTSLPRAAVRTDGSSGFIFVNNHVRQLAMPARPGFQVRVTLPAGAAISVPSQPVTVPADRYFAWPFGLRLGKSLLQYSTAQLLTEVETPAGKIVVFFAIPGIAPEFAFASATVGALAAPAAVTTRAGGATLVRGITPGMNAAIGLTDKDGGKVTILLLTQEQAEHTARFRINGADHLLCSDSALFFDGHAVHLQSHAARQELAILPDLAFKGSSRSPAGRWTRYRFSQPEKHPSLAVRQLQQATPRPRMTMGPYVDWRKTAVPAVPPEEAYAGAARWQIQWLNPDMVGLSEALLQMDYTGDLGRLKSGGTLLDDNFYKGLPWQVGLHRFSAETWKSPLTLEVLPMPAEAPIYLEPQAWERIRDGSQGAPKLRVTLVPVYESIAETVARPGR